MLHGDIARFSAMARNNLAHMGYGNDSFWSWKQDMAALLGPDSASQLAEAKERDEARKNIQLDYDYHNMELNHQKSYRAEVKGTLDLIEQRQPHLQLYHTKGDIYWSFKGKKNHINTVDIYRLEAPDGYCFDFEYDEMTSEDGETTQAAHVKFIMQRDTDKQGNGTRMHRHVVECTDILFNQGVNLVWGMASGINQFEVKESRHGKNWRDESVRIKDAFGKISHRMIRLLACYLRQGWVLLGEKKEGAEQIAYMSPTAIKLMVDKLGNQALDEFKYAKNYEKIKSTYGVRHTH